MIVRLSSGGDHELILAEGTGRFGGDALVEREQDVVARQEHGPGRDDDTPHWAEFSAAESLSRHEVRQRQQSMQRSWALITEGSRTRPATTLTRRMPASVRRLMSLSGIVTPLSCVRQGNGLPQHCWAVEAYELPPSS